MKRWYVLLAGFPPCLPTYTASFERLHLDTLCVPKANEPRLTRSSREWFTFCFVPIIPFSLKPYKEVGCHVCNFHQDIKYRPDVQQQIGGGGQGQQPAVMMHGGQGGYGAPPSGVPQYK
jgi:hypothetical protein